VPIEEEPVYKSLKTENEFLNAVATLLQQINKYLSFTANAFSDSSMKYT
jgi:hypothetical protein